MKFTEGKYKEQLWISRLKMWKTAQNIVKSVVKVDSYDTGKHYKSIKIQKISNYEINIESNQRQSIISEFGRRKNQKAPPFDSLVWRVIRKLWLPGKVRWWYQDQPMITRRAIRNIAIHIWKFGIKALHLYSLTIDKNKSKLLQAMK